MYYYIIPFSKSFEYYVLTCYISDEKYLVTYLGNFTVQNRCYVLSIHITREFMRTNKQMIRIFQDIRYSLAEETRLSENTLIFARINIRLI